MDEPPEDLRALQEPLHRSLARQRSRNLRALFPASTRSRRSRSSRPSPRPRARHPAARPAVSLAYLEADGVAVIVHGRATPVGRTHPGFDAVDAFRRSVGRMGLHGWSPTA